MAEARTILTNYANGMPVTSEAESFAELAARVKEKDPTKGEILDKGLAEIKARPSIAPRSPSSTKPLKTGAGAIPTLWNC